MSRLWRTLDQQERARFETAVSFLEGRLCEYETVQWALDVAISDRVEMAAIDHLINLPANLSMPDPWRAAWRFIEESWRDRLHQVEMHISVYDIKARLRLGDRSGSLIASIVDLVRPRLKVEAFSSWSRENQKRPSKPKAVSDLFWPKLSSGNLVDPAIVGIAELNEIEFLVSLATALEASVDHGLDIARRTGWSVGESFVGVGFLHRVYYTQTSGFDDDETEPDRYHKGLAPAVKLLHFVVELVSFQKMLTAQNFARRWLLKDTPVYERLYAALCRDPNLASASEVGSFLGDLDNRRFWNVHSFPEIAELRARRFGDLDSRAKAALVRRLRNGPPKDQWPKEVPAEKVARGKLYWSVRELRRIEILSGGLPEDAKAWLDQNLLSFDELRVMSAHEGFQDSVSFRGVASEPDNKYDSIERDDRLQSLEQAFSSTQADLNNITSGGATSWIQSDANSALILLDLNASENGGDAFPHVWERFSWAHTPKSAAEATVVLSLLVKLSTQTTAIAIAGISYWLSRLSEETLASENLVAAWMAVWPIAVAATNSMSDDESSADLSIVARSSSEEDDPMDLDTLNTPAGRLVGVFLSCCPSLNAEKPIFAPGSIERTMRDAIESSDGRSSLIARHRMLEVVQYFLKADSEWAERYLLRPLSNDGAEALALWRAIARRPRFKDTLEVIGDTMLIRASDPKLPRKTRSNLVFNLVVEALHALRENRTPAVPYTKVQQLIRTIDDEARSMAANILTEFVVDVSSKEDKSLSAESLFKNAVSPFLNRVWPQERSLASPGVSRSLADLPSAVGNAFANAVEDIERYLVPFDCWSMLDFGLHGADGEQPKLSIINDESKAKAFLRLLDKTIGTSETAVVPFNISAALEQIETVAPKLRELPEFRRLAAAARRPT